MNNEYDELSSFLGEAEELVSGLYETLSNIDPGAPPKQNDINSLFRATHTMKGLAGMLDYQNLGGLSHSLEDLLGVVRLGHLGWTDDVHEVISQGVDHLREIIQSIGGGGSDAGDLSAYIKLVAELSSQGTPEEAAPTLNIPEEVRGTFTEYEESRLAANLKEGNHLFEITFRIKLAEFARIGKEISEALEATGEIITKLPAPGSGAELTFLYIVRNTRSGLRRGTPPDLRRDSGSEPSAHSGGRPGDAERRTAARRNTAGARD